MRMHRVTLKLTVIRMTLEWRDESHTLLGKGTLYTAKSKWRNNLGEYLMYGIKKHNSSNLWMLAHDGELMIKSDRIVRFRSLEYAKEWVQYRHDHGRHLFMVTLIPDEEAA